MQSYTSAVHEISRLVFALIFVLTTSSLAQHEQAFRFNFNDGSSPQGALVADAAGNFYGTTFYGGTGGCRDNNGKLIGCGTVYEMSPPASPATQWTQTVIFNFSGEGVYPRGSLVFDSVGDLYGVTTQGGDSGNGIVFELLPPSQTGGNWTETTLYNFGGGSDGGNPQAGLIIDQSGNLYGTALGNGGCGVGGCGVVFEVFQGSDGRWLEIVLYGFQGGFDGAHPHAPLVSDASGNFFGTTSSGGLNDSGIVFELSPSGDGGTWTETILHNFGEADRDGLNPAAGLTLGPKGVFLGTTVKGGSFGGGTVFGLQPPSNPGPWGYKVLYNFGATLADGLAPYCNLTILNESVYGTTSIGGAFNAGTVFQLEQFGAGTLTETSMYSFTGGQDGGMPLAGVISTGYALYGTTSGGGFQNNGTAFRVSR